MGFLLMRAAQRHGRSLDANAFKVLLAMADRAKDADTRPCYFAGLRQLAAFLPEVPESAKDPRRAREEKVRRAVKALVIAGLVRPMLPASQVHDSTYQRYDLSALLQSPTRSVGHEPHGDRGALDEQSPTPSLGHEPHAERAQSPTPGEGRKNKRGSKEEEVVGGDVVNAPAEAPQDDSATPDWQFCFDKHGAPYWLTPDGERAPVDETRRARFPHLPDWALSAPESGDGLPVGWLLDGGPADHAEQTLAHDPTSPAPATLTGPRDRGRGWPIDIDYQDNDRVARHVRARLDLDAKPTVWWVRDLDWFDLYWRLLGGDVLGRWKHDPRWTS